VNVTVFQHSRSLRSLALVLLAASTGIAAACGGGSDSSSGRTRVAQAAYVTSRGPGYRTSIDINIYLKGQHSTIKGDGALGERGRVGSLDLEIGGKHIKEIVKSPYIYVAAPSDADQSATAGKPWLRANSVAYSQATGASGLSSDASSPKELLGFLQTNGKVSAVGSETVRGVETKRFHALIDLRRYGTTVPSRERAAAERSVKQLERITGGGTLPIDVWIDSQHRVRRVSLQLHTCIKGGKLDESIVIELYDYGRQPAIAVPAPSEVHDITAKLDAVVAKGVAQLGC
jgi:hypothetical protein